MATSSNHLTRFITDAPLSHVGEDPYALKEQAIAWLQELAPDTWTDHNEHDPGVTILEVLCYVLSDLGYRLDYPVVDLLTNADGTSADELPLPHELLPMGPVTLLDLRKVIIDVAGINNAWVYPEREATPAVYYDAQHHTLTFEPKGNEPIRLKGLFRVVVELEWNQLGKGEVIRRAVRRQLMSYRNLGEDLARIDIASSMPIAIRGVVEIETQPDPYELLAFIFQTLNDYIAPSPRFRTYQEMIDLGFDHAQIHDGPLLDHGFLIEEELARATPKTELRTSDLIRRIMDIAGVRVVKSLVLVFNDTEYPWFLSIPDQQIPRFEESRSDITLHVEGIPIGVDVAQATQQLANWRKSRRPSPKPLAQRFRALPTGQFRDAAYYHSLQNHLPEVYGVGEYGLPERVSDLRKSQAAQLKGFLLVFDQILANQFAQIGAFKTMISPTQGADQSRFSQTLLNSVPGARNLLNPWLPLTGINPIGADQLHGSLPYHTFRKGECIWLMGAGHLNGEYQITEEYPEGFDAQKIGTPELSFPPKTDPVVCRTDTEWEQRLQAITDPTDDQLTRLHRMYDHLLARYGEVVPDHLRYFAHTQQEHRSLSQNLLLQKQEFLKAYVLMGQNRAQGIDYTHQELSPAGDEQFSGLERRLCLLLGLGPGRRQWMSEALDRVQRVLPRSYQLVGTWPEVLAAAMTRSQWNERDGFTELRSAAGNVLATAKVRTWEGGPTAEQAWMEWWKESLTLEGLHLVEHILFRPRTEDDHPAQRVLMLLSKPIVQVSAGTEAQTLVIHSPNHGLEAGEPIKITLNETYKGTVLSVAEDQFLAAVVDPPTQLDGLSGYWRREPFRKDPYSLQVSLVLPKWPGRLQNSGFCALVERTLREETPAHLRLYLHWLDVEEMREFEHYYREWMLTITEPADGNE